MENRSRAEVQVRRIVSDYELGELIGRGAFSEVFKARHLEKGGIYAVKVMNNRILTENVKVK
jgi:serine/threonine protein kinase